MAKFEMIKYHNREYSNDIPLCIEEIAAHFDVKGIYGQLAFSLHTEYSYGKRNFGSELIKKYPEIVAAQKDGVPQLWKNSTWAIQFANFIIELIGNKPQPKVIEIHPPFDDYTNIEKFVDDYSIFENIIKEHYPQVEILIENRCGSVYQGGKFILSRTQDIYRLAEIVKTKGLNLKMAYDIPQIYTAHFAKTERQYIGLLDDIKDIRWFIGGVHLWGKSISESGRKVSHCGDLNSYFEDENIKRHFLQKFKEVFDDNVTRKMVLEVNSGNKDMQSIINDLKNIEIQFV